MHFDTSSVIMHYSMPWRADFLIKIGENNLPGLLVAKSIKLAAARPLGPNFQMIY